MIVLLIDSGPSVESRVWHGEVDVVLEDAGEPSEHRALAKLVWPRFDLAEQPKACSADTELRAGEDCSRGMEVSMLADVVELIEG